MNATYQTIEPADASVSDDTTTNGVWPTGNVSCANRAVPMKVSVGLARKVEQAEFGCLDAHCNVELELDGALLQHDFETFQQHLRRAFQACAQAVNDELTRSEALHPGPRPADGPASEEAVNQIVAEVMDDNEAQEEDEPAARTTAAPAAKKRSAPAPSAAAPAGPARTAPQEKPAEKPAAPLPAARPKKADDENPADRNRRIRNWIILSACPVLLCAAWLLRGPATYSADALAARALSAGELSQRVEAAVQLTMFRQPDPTPQLRQLAEKTKDPEVLIQALNGLSARVAPATLPFFLAALDHSSSMVRASAWAGLQRVGPSLCEGVDFKPDAPDEERAGVTRRLKEMYNELLSSIPKDAKV